MPFMIMGVIAALGAFQQAEAKRRQQEYQASVAGANAMAMEQQAQLKRVQVEKAREAADRDQHKAKRDYYEAAGTNSSLLSAGNVDISSGSALGLLEGNANRFADDMAEMEHQKELDTYTGKREISNLEWRADLFESNESYLKSTAGSTGESLLTAGMAGASSFMGGKAAAGKY